MKTINILPDIECKDPRTGTVLCVKSHKDIAFDCWLNDPRGGAKPADLYRWGKVIEKFAACAPNTTIELDDQDWEKLKTIVAEPQVSYPPILGLQLLPFSDAVLNAT